MRTVEMLLRCAIDDAVAGRYHRFLQKVEESIQRDWTPKEIIDKSQMSNPTVVSYSALREVARHLGKPPKEKLKEAQQLGWRFFEKSVLSRSEEYFIYHSTLYACWVVLRDLLKLSSERYREYQAVEKHFSQYLVRVKRLRERYNQEVPAKEYDRLGKEMLGQLRKIVRAQQQRSR